MATARLSGLYNMTTPRKRAHCIYYLGISNAKLFTVVVLEFDFALAMKKLHGLVR
jgi:hypothetical protein